MTARKYANWYIACVFVMNALLIMVHPLINMLFTMMSFGIYLAILVLPSIFTLYGINRIENGKPRTLFYISIVIYVIMFCICSEWYTDPIKYADESGSNWSYNFNSRLINTAVFLISMALLVMYIQALNSDTFIAKNYLYIFAGIVAIFIAAVVFTINRENQLTSQLRVDVTRLNKKFRHHVLEKLRWHYTGIKSVTFEEIETKSLTYKDGDLVSGNDDFDDFEDKLNLLEINDKTIADKKQYLWSDIVYHPTWDNSIKESKRLGIVGHKDSFDDSKPIKIKIKKVSFDKIK